MQAVKALQTIDPQYFLACVAVLALVLVVKIIVNFTEALCAKMLEKQLKATQLDYTSRAAIAKSIDKLTEAIKNGR